MIIRLEGLEKILETGSESLASQIQTEISGMEGITEDRANEGGEMGDSVTEGELLLGSSLVAADGSMVIEDKCIDTENLCEEKKGKKKEKKSKMKQAAFVADIEAKEEQTTENQAFKRTEMCDFDGAHEGGLLLKSSPVRADDNIIFNQKVVDQDTNETVVTVGNLHVEKKDQTTPKKHKKKKALSVAVNPEKNPETEVEKFASQDQTNGMEQATVNQTVEETEMRDNTQEGSFLPKSSSIGADDNFISENKIIDKDTAENVVTVGNLLKETKDKKMRNNRKRKRAVNPHLEELKEGEMFPNQIAEASSLRNTDSTLSMGGIMSRADESTRMIIDNISGDKPESMTYKGNKDCQVIDIVKPPRDTDKSQHVKEELVIKDSGETMCKIETLSDIKKNDISAVTAAEVAVNDTENPGTCKKNKKQKKRKLSSVSQLELTDKDGAKESTMKSSPVIDTEPKQSTEVNNVDSEEGMPIGSSSISVKDACFSISNGEAIPEKILLPSPARNCNSLRSPSRKLLILDINGLLADIVAPVPSGFEPDIMLSRKAVFKRPFCESFLQFCFEKFDVGVWSSRVKLNVDKVLDFLMGEMKNKLVFYWDRSHCTITGFPTIENSNKPLVFKKLRKLWDDHPLHRGKYDQNNTLLLDDSPYKALCNPADTAIFPLSYQYTDLSDSSLGPGGDLRVYLEGLAMADNIPEYVRNNPFGQRPIRETNLSWKYYKQVLHSRRSRRYR